MRHSFLLPILFSAALATVARGEIVWTLEGQSYEGSTVLSVPHAITVTPAKGRPATIPFEHILLVTLSAPQPPAPEPKPVSAGTVPRTPAAEVKPWPAGTMPRGILFKNGSFLANAAIRNGDNKTVSLAHAAFRGEVPLAQLARVISAPLTPAQLGIVNDRVGVLTNAGDFSEGEVVAFEPRQVKLSSVVLGIAPFHIGGYPNSVIAINLRKPQYEDARFILTLVDGSTLLADSLECVANDQLRVAERALGRIKLHPSDVFSIRASADAATALTALKPRESAKLKDFRATATSAFDLTSSANVPVGAGFALVLPAGGSVTYELGAKYDSLTCRVGVPAKVSEKATLRFTFMADGKAVDPPRMLTKRDPPQQVSVALKGVKMLGIKVESEDATAIGALADPLLLPSPK